MRLPALAGASVRGVVVMLGTAAATAAASATAITEPLRTRWGGPIRLYAGRAPVARPSAEPSGGGGDSYPHPETCGNEHDDRATDDHRGKPSGPPRNITGYAGPG